MSTDRLRVLVAGETWVSLGFHLKGVATYQTGGYSSGLEPLRRSLEEAGWEVTHIPNHLATTQFPAVFDDWDAVVLSDIPADTLLLHPDTFDHGTPTPDRLALLAQYVEEGGGLLMIGGYMSYSGFEGKARYQNTPLAAVLPVGMLGYDDRVETPSGIRPRPLDEHPVLRDIAGDWPMFLGYNRLRANEGATVVLEAHGDPFLVLGSHGRGRVGAFASDCSPHWGSPEFLEWPAYGRFWDQLLRWISGRSR